MISEERVEAIAAAVATSGFDRDARIAVQQQFAIPLRGVIGVGAEGVLGDVRIAQPHLAVIDGGERVDQGSTSGTQRFHFSAGQHHACLKAVVKVVVMARFAILRNQHPAFGSGHDTTPPELVRTAPAYQLPSAGHLTDNASD